MNKTLFRIFVLVFLCGVQSLYAQVFRLDANVELTAASFNPSTEPERKINTNFRDDDPFNPVRGKLFPHITFNETFGIEGEVLFDNKAKKFDRSRNAQVRIDGLFAFAHGLLGNRLNFWLGRIPTPVGAFSPRSYSHMNPLIGYPLAYQYKVPYNAFVLSSEIANLSLRDRNFGASTSIYEACWITGLSIFGTVEGIDYMLAIGRGTLTNPEASENKGFQLAGRIGRKFGEIFGVGVSGGIAPYLQHDVNLPADVGIRDPKHVIAGIDANASFANVHLHAEAFLNSWDTPQYQLEKTIQAYTWYIEGQFFFLPELYAAARLDHMLYTDITDPSNGQKTPWGYDITRIETGIGYRPLPELLLKGVVQYNTLENPATKEITIVTLQAAFHFKDVQTLIGLQ